MFNDKDKENKENIEDGRIQKRMQILLTTMRVETPTLLYVVWAKKENRALRRAGLPSVLVDMIIGYREKLLHEFDFRTKWARKEHDYGYPFSSNDEEPGDKYCEEKECALCHRSCDPDDVGPDHLCEECTDTFTPACRICLGRLCLKENELVAIKDGRCIDCNYKRRWM